MLSISRLSVIFAVFSASLFDLSVSQFICNNYKNQAACDGSQASDGICQWGMFGCSSVRPLPSPDVVVRTAPPLVCPPFVAEAACIYDACQISQVCFANSDAVCVINNCVGEFDYLGRTLSDPCSAVFVDLVTNSVVDCNVREIVREAEEDAATKSASVEEEVEEPGTQSVSGITLGLPPADTTPAEVEEEVVDEEEEPSTSMTLGLPSNLGATPAEAEQEPFSLSEILNMDTAPTPEP